MISANGGLPAHRYTPQVTQRWPRGSEPASMASVIPLTVALTLPLPQSPVRRSKVCMNLKNFWGTAASHSSSDMSQQPTLPIPASKICGLTFASLGLGDVEMWLTESETPGERHWTAIRQIPRSSSNLKSSQIDTIRFSEIHRLFTNTPTTHLSLHRSQQKCRVRTAMMVRSVPPFKCNLASAPMMLSAVFPQNLKSCIFRRAISNCTQ